MPKIYIPKHTGFTRFQLMKTPPNTKEKFQICYDCSTKEDCDNPPCDGHEEGCYFCGATNVYVIWYEPEKPEET